MTKKKQVLTIIKYFIDEKLYDINRLKTVCSKTLMEQAESDNQQVELLINGLNIAPLIKQLGLSSWIYDKELNEITEIKKEWFIWR